MGTTPRALEVWPRPHLSWRPRRALTAFGALYAALSTALVIGVDPLAVGALAILATFLLLAAIEPVAPVYLLVVTAWVPLENLFGDRRDVLASVGGGVNVSGVRLGAALMAFVVALAVLRRHAGVLRTLPALLRGALVVYAAALVWLALSVAWSPERFEGIRAVGKLGIPLLAGWVLLADAQKRGSATAVRRILMCLVATVLAGTVYGAVGVYARDLLPAEASGVASWYGWAGWSLFGFIVAIAGVCAFAAAQYRIAGEARALAALTLIQVPLCLKRITVAAVFAALCYLAALPGKRRWLPASIAVAAVLALALYPPLKERMWSSQKGSVAAFLANPSLDAIRLEGRDQLWRTAIEATHGVEVLIGHGVGAFASLSPSDDGSVASGQLHSEVVRMFYDGGAIGALLVFAALTALGVALARMGMRTTDRYARGAAYGGSATVLVYLVTSLTDNTLDYYTVGAYAAAAIVAAVLVCDLRREEAPQ